MTPLLLILTLLLTARLLQERRRRRALRGDYIGKVWFLRARLRAAEDEADALRDRLLARTVYPYPYSRDAEGDGDHLPLPAIIRRKVPPA